MCVCVCVYLSPTQADVEQVVELGSFGGEAGSDHGGCHGSQGAVVETQSHVAGRVGEQTVAVAHAVLLHTHTHSHRLALSNQVQMIPTEQ